MINKKILIGTSGYSYSDWKGNFYPDNLSSSKWFDFYCKNFSTIEINSTYYRMMSEVVFSKWRSIAPHGFTFAVKAHRYLTFKSIWTMDSDKPFRAFYNSIDVLGDKLGPILYLFLPNTTYDEKAFMEFLKKIDLSKKTCVEIRHTSWLNEQFYKMLKDNNISLCISDSGGKYPHIEKPKLADHVYIRMHGPKGLYSSRYSLDELKEWSSKIKSFNKKTYVYFDNDFKAYAPVNAKELISMF